MQTILVCDDDRQIVEAIEIYLNGEGYRILKAYDGQEALDLLKDNEVNLMILDVMMPGLDGLRTTMKVRETSSIPIIILSAKSEDTDKILGLNIGADDYITKPFGAAELLARIRVALRHTHNSAGTQANGGCFVAGDLTVDYDKHQVLIRGENMKLTQNEFRIVALLSRYAGKVLTYDYIMKELWGPQNGGGNQILRVNMANIRRKIEKNPGSPEYLLTEIGVGYRLADME